MSDELKPTKRICGTGWSSDGMRSCESEATHRAVSTNGVSLLVFRVCEACAKVASLSTYKANSQGSAAGQTQMLPGDPLWLIWPPLPSDELTAQAAELSRLRVENVALRLSLTIQDEALDDLRARLTAAEGERDRLREFLPKIKNRVEESMHEYDDTVYLMAAVVLIDAALAPAPASGEPPINSPMDIAAEAVHSLALVHSMVTRALAEPPDGSAALVAIATYLEEVLMGTEPAQAAPEGRES